ncbi:signal peptidase I [Desulfobulbus propionicus]|jgi:signal peptidase I
MPKNLLHRFLLPELNRFFLLRVLALILATVLIFTQVLLPLRIEGQSMEPTYTNGFNFCWRGRYLFASPQRGDVVVIRFAGHRVLLLKRIVALAGDTVAFAHGVLLVNGRPVNEPYVRFRADWNLEPRTVEPGKVYVVGDNRGVPMNRHHFGQVEQQRIVGGLLW